MGSGEMKNQTLQYFMHDGPSSFRFELAGHMDSEGARRLDQDWRTALSVIGDRTLIIDMTFVTGASDDGRDLLARWHAAGAQFVAESTVSRELAEGIAGRPLAEPVPSGHSGADWTWLPFRRFFGGSNLHLTLVFASLLLPVQLYAAHLKTETVAAWDNYVQSVHVSLQERIRPGGSFLWTSEDPERLAEVHAGEIVVAPASGENPRKVPGGLIHHWIGAAFLPGAKLDDILNVTRDYDRYKEFYRPYVIESKMVARNDLDDNFSMLVMNKALFLKMALDADYCATNVRLDERRFYSVSKTTRVQEVQDYGEPGERRIPEGEGGGYIWKLFNIARLEQRDGGVYIEMETVALSREIPALMRFVVDPIVRRVSRNSILTSIQQTEEAVCCNSQAGKKPANSPGSADRAISASTVQQNRASAFTPIR
jgi:hypothetical protein